MLKISDFNYNLPDERIAKFPVAERDQSKLLIYNKGVIFEDIFCCSASTDIAMTYE